MLTPTEMAELQEFKRRFSYANEVEAELKDLNRLVGNELYSRVLTRGQETGQGPLDVVRNILRACLPEHDDILNLDFDPYSDVEA